jgi:hypothetical protein
MFFVQMVNQAPKTLSILEAVLQGLFLFLLRNHLFLFDHMAGMFLSGIRTSLLYKGR